MNRTLLPGAVLTASLALALGACVSQKPLASLEGLKSSRVNVIQWKKGSIGVLPGAIANTVKACWEKDPLFEGFTASQPVMGPNGTAVLSIEGPLKGDPPQRFLIVIVPAANGKPGYSVDMDYPIGSNYAFVRMRLAGDIKTLEGGQRPCS